MENSHLPEATRAAYAGILDGLRITDQSALERILKVLAMLDDIRWERPVNSTSVNYSSDDLTADEKLLSHWLCYITDRQMPFRRIWEIGGYVFSNLVRAYTSQPELGVQDLLHRYLRQEKGRWRFECDLFDADDDAAKRLGPFGAVRNGKVSFASRYIPDDVVRIAHTLMFLDRVGNRSLSRFMANALPDPPNADDNRRRTIRRLAAALDAMTYLHGGSASASDFGQQITSLPETMENYVRSYVEQRTQTLDSWLEGFYPFGRKRLWCSLRDYLKSPELNAVFVSALEKVGFADSRSWLRDNSDLREALDAMELPGDVWNNSPVFKDGLLVPYIKYLRNLDTPGVARGIYELLAQQGIRTFYPEQLDVTFEFVPRMCDTQMCDVCLFGAGIKGICHELPGRWCSVALVSCGYRHRCDPEDCEFKYDLAKGLCTASTCSG